MTYQEFSALLGGGWYDSVEAPCHTPECGHIEKMLKSSALRNFQRNGGIFKCVRCSFTEEGKKRMGEAASYKRNDATKKKMSDAKIAFFKTPEGQALKDRLSKLTAEKQGTNFFDKHKRHRHFISEKNNCVLYCGSSYEVRACFLLEHDDSVESFKTQITYYPERGGGRCLDLLIVYKSKEIKAVEIKPESRLNEPENISQINDALAFAEKSGYSFDVWTEEFFEMSERELRNWADEYCTAQGFFDYLSHKKKSNCEKSKKYYANNIKNDKVDVYCEYCKITHQPLRKTYEAALEEKGRFICEREGGHIAGSKPKLTLRKDNPHAEQGKKECNLCHNILPFECFSPDKTKRDGFSTRCKKCRARGYKERYQKLN